MISLRALQALMVAAAVAATGIACSSTEPDPPPVASLVTQQSAAEPSTAASSAAALKAAEERPRERLDMTAEESEALRQPWEKCMTEHGVSKKDMRNLKFDETAKGAPAKACESKRPLPAWEWDPKNTEAKDFWYKVAKCLRGKGVKHVDLPEGGIGLAFGGKNNDSQSISKGMELAPDCEKEVLKSKK
jgi:hypothetical protein